MADFNLHTRPQVTRYSPLIKYGVLTFAVALVGLFLWARNSQSEAKFDDRTILRQSAREFKEPAPPPPPVVAQQLPEPLAPQQYVEAPTPPPPPPPREAPQPDPDIARRKEALLKAMVAPLRVEGFGEAATKQVAQGPQQPFGQGQDTQLASNEHYMPGTMQRARSPYQLNSGSIIPATVMRPVTTDAPGQMVALVSLDVFDSVSGQYLLIPQGSRVVGRYDPEMGPQSRLNAVYHEIQFPNGCSFPLAPTPILDAQGFAGVKDHVNNHFIQRYGAVVGLAAITAMVGLTGNSSNHDYHDYSPQREAAQGAGRVFERAVEQDLRRAMAIPATGTIRGGFPFNLDVVQTIAFDKPYNEKENCQ